MSNQYANLATRRSGTGIRPAIILLACLSLLGLHSTGGTEPNRTGSNAARKMLFLGPSRPLRLLVEFTIDRNNIAALRQTVVQQLFDKLDRDHDGRLTVDEGMRVVALGEKYQAITPDDWLRLDTHPAGGDGYVSPAEFAPLVTSRLGNPLDLRAAPSPAAHAVRLFERLDGNGDRIVSDVELMQTGQVLRRLDYDEDEAISTVELLPFENPLLPVAPDEPMSVELKVPFIDVTADSDREHAAQELVALYQRGSDPDRGLTISEIGWTQGEFEALDDNGDGWLDRGEIKRMFADFTPDVEISVVLPHQQRVRPSISARVLRRLPIHVRQKGRDRIAIVNQNVQLTMRALSTMSKSYDNVQYYRLRFYQTDADKNKYLDESEFRQVGLNAASFAAVDADGDGQITREELIQFVRGSASTSQSRLVMAVGKDGRTLFEAADTNYDLRLSPRELRSAPGLLIQFDRDQDGALEETEMTHEFHVTFSLGTPELFNMSTNTRNNRRRRNPRVYAANEGPVWFRHMDRNQDGDVSWPEFLGTQAEFARLDTDSDKLISASEAESRAGE